MFVYYERMCVCVCKLKFTNMEILRLFQKKKPTNKFINPGTTEQHEDTWWEQVNSTSSTDDKGVKYGKCQYQ